MRKRLSFRGSGITWFIVETHKTKMERQYTTIDDHFPPPDDHSRWRYAWEVTRDASMISISLVSLWVLWQMKNIVGSLNSELENVKAQINLTEVGSCIHKICHILPY